ncbi:9815_t:CDS:1, partial [Entrophospora sp. SA101]
VPAQNHPIDPDRMECLHQYAIELGEDSKQFSVVTESEKKMRDEKCFRDKLERDMRFYRYAVKEGLDPKKCSKLTDRDRLTGGDLLHRGILESGLSTAWLDELMKEWEKTISNA